MENRGKQETYSREDRYASSDSQNFLSAARASAILGDLSPSSGVLRVLCVLQREGKEKRQRVASRKSTLFFIRIVNQLDA